MTWEVAPNALSAQPDPKTARALRHTLNATLVKDLRKFCGVAAGALPQAARSAQLAVEQIDPERRLAPFLFGLHQDLRAALVAQDRAAVLSLLDQLVLLVQSGEHHCGARTLRSREQTAVDRVVAGVVAVSYGAEGESYAPLLSVAEEQRTQVLDRAQAGADLLAQADPDLSGEADELLSDLVVARGGPEGITSLKFFGCAQIRVPDLESGAAAQLYFTENIVHETSHLTMYAMMNIDPMMANAELGRYTSPLRRDPRPLYGIYHATFVLARLTRLYSRLAAADHAPSAPALRDEQRKKFYDGYNTLAANADFTPAGRQVMESCRDLVDSSC
jgi:HEXXH motif-containing protein